jgi:hypothetical protein
MAKSSSFRHSVDIRHDERIAALIGNHGATGYGIYWMIVEMLHRREDMRIEYNDTMLRRMSAQLGLKHMEFKVLLQELIELYELFAREDGYLVSTLVYRKPKKPRQVAEHQEPNQVPVEYPVSGQATGQASEGLTPSTPSNDDRRNPGSGQRQQQDIVAVQQIHGSTIVHKSPVKAMVAGYHSEVQAGFP